MLARKEAGQARLWGSLKVQGKEAKRGLQSRDSVSKESMGCRVHNPLPIHDFIDFRIMLTYLHMTQKETSSRRFLEKKWGGGTNRDPKEVYQWQRLAVAGSVLGRGRGGSQVGG